MSTPYQITEDVFEVHDTAEFRRVFNLPRRDWETEAKRNDLYLRMSRAFRTPHGQQVLRPIQASSLADAHDMGGLFAPIRVGEGKTLLSYLIAVVIPGVQRPTLLLPAGLIEKTWREFKELQKHWLCHPALMTRKGFDAAVISYEMLGRTSGKDKLNERMPDLIIADECHNLRNRTAARTRRVERYMTFHSKTKFCGLSGTITKRSIKDYWHLIYWALKERMPLPRIESEMDKWADVIDERKSDALNRRGPGVLLHFCSPEELAEASPPQRSQRLGVTSQMDVEMLPETHRKRAVAARRGYQRRLRESYGVISSPDTNLDCSLVIRRIPVDPGRKVVQLIEQMRETKETPNGELMITPVEIWRHARELASGFWYRWDPPPPEHWKQARKTWHWVVRQILDAGEGIFYHIYQQFHLDSPMQVALAIEQGKIPDPRIQKAYETWKKVRGDYKINVVADWVSDATIQACLDWIQENKAGIVWTEHKAFGERLAQVAGTGFCSQGGLDANGRSIEEYAGRGVVVASVAANSTGRNLQAWNRNLIVTASPTGALWEQLIGRTHRPGQSEDTVYVDWISACAEQDDGFSQVLSDARYIQDTTGQSQKVLYGDKT